jgi:hypothetical protein
MAVAGTSPRPSASIDTLGSHSDEGFFSCLCAVASRDRRSGNDSVEPSSCRQVSTIGTAAVKQIIGVLGSAALPFPA